MNSRNQWGVSTGWIGVISSAVLLAACGGGEDGSATALSADGGRQSRMAVASVGSVFINEVNVANWKGAVGCSRRDR